MTITEPRPTDLAVEPEPDDGPPAAVPPLWRAPRITRSGLITAGIAVLAAVLYLWQLDRVGYGNDYYAAAVRSMATSWKAFLFGALDPGSFITVDKPPAALWVQALSVRAFGFSSWSMLVPEALAGVGSVLIVHRMVREWMGDVAAHLAALGFALTPVAVVMFRYNNPDALLTLLGLGAAWAVWSACRSGRTRLLLLAGGLTGLAFQTKMLQALLVLPALGLVYLLFGPPRLGRRVLQLAGMAAAMAVSAGWWVAIVALWPAATRPYIGSTTDNSILSLIFGYNGLSRIFGGEGPRAGAGGGPGGGAGGGAGFGESPGWLRMFNDAVGGQVGWLVPMALAGLAAGLWLTRRAPRTDRGRAGWVLWGTWALVSMAVFSLSEGIFHPYYTVQLAPAIAALAGAGAVALWRLGRSSPSLRFALPAAVAATGALAYGILGRTPDFARWLRPLVLVGSLGAAALLWLGSELRRRSLVLVGAGLAAAALLAGPTAYALTTVANPASGALASAGPATGGGGLPGGGAPGGTGGTVSGGTAAVDDALVEYLQANQGDATWLVAGVGSQSTASIIIATGEPVITIGGFNGGDPSPTLEQLQRLVADGELRFVLLGGGGPGGGAGGSAELTQWVTANGTPVDGFSNLYDLS